jgi:hypothetical protein
MQSVFTAMCPLARGINLNNPPHFYTFADLYQKLIAQTEPLQRRDVVSLDSFSAWLRRCSLRIDASLAWEELRSILKGACLNLGRPMLEEQEYYDLGRKRAPLFADDRPQIFAIAQRYQQWLHQTGAADQIDLCRAAFRQSRHGRGGRYDVIVCDEVQDLTELEVAFVLSLSSSKDLGGVVLAGDSQQIVNPTGFRWAEVRQSILKVTGGITAPKPVRLRRNCRSVRPLVEFANSLLNLKQQIFGRYEEDGFEDAVAEGSTPIQIAASERQVLDAIRDFGPRCAILVMEDTEVRHLRRVARYNARLHHTRRKGPGIRHRHSVETARTGQGYGRAIHARRFQF